MLILCSCPLHQLLMHVRTNPRYGLRNTHMNTSKEDKELALGDAICTALQASTTSGQLPRLVASYKKKGWKVGSTWQLLKKTGHATRNQQQFSKLYNKSAASITNRFVVDLLYDKSTNRTSGVWLSWADFQPITRLVQNIQAFSNNHFTWLSVTKQT